MLLLTMISVWLIFAVATFPGERLHALIPDVEFEWTPHKLLVAGNVDEIRQRPRSFGSNRLVLPGVDLREHPKFETKEKIETRPMTLRLRGRRLENAILEEAYLPKADFAGAALRGANLRSAQLQGASFSEAQLQGVRFDLAELQGASLDRAKLQGASLFGAQLQGASLFHARLKGALLFMAQLQGASLDEAQLQGATLWYAELRGASLRGAQLQAARLDSAQLQGASLDYAQFQGALLRSVQLQGASLSSANLSGALLIGSFVWRTRTTAIGFQNVYIENNVIEAKYGRNDCMSDKTCEWSAGYFATLQRLIMDKVPAGERQKAALNRISLLNPEKEFLWEPNQWIDFSKHRPTKENYRKIFVQILRDAGCKTDDAPYVIESLLSQMWNILPLDDLSKRNLAATFLDEANCPGARGLSESEKAKLRKMSERAPSIPAAPDPPDKAAQ